MTYSEALDYINVKKSHTNKPSLEALKELLKVLENPHKNLKFIHIVGTNGKGSVTTMLSNVLQNANYKVGKFISPYVYDFEERISVNSINIPKDKLIKYVSIIKNAIETNNFSKPTHFSLVLAVALMYFRDEHCDIVCLEAGIGGKLDSTNIIDSPLLSIITKVAFDHTNILGNTLEEIALDKCQIIKESLCVSYPLQDENVLNTFKDFNIFMPKIDNLKINSSDLKGSDILYNEKSYKISLIGEHQIYNAITVINACEKLCNLGINIGYYDIYKALSKTHFEGRMEIIKNDPLVIFDGSHNEDGISALCNTIKTQFKDKRILIIMAMQKDKNYKECVEKISSQVDIALYTQLDLPTTATCAELLEHNKAPNSMAFYNAETAVKLSKNFTKDVTIVCGSFYLDVKKFF